MRARCPTDTTTSGGLSEPDMNALAVMACSVSPQPVETTTTPVAKRPNARRSRRSPASTGNSATRCTPGSINGAAGAGTAASDVSRMETQGSAIRFIVVAPPTAALAASPTADEAQSRQSIAPVFVAIFTVASSCGRTHAGLCAT
jgi:hypothetical protein